MSTTSRPASLQRRTRRQLFAGTLAVGAAGMAVALLAACGGSTAATGTTSTQAAPASSSAAAATTASAASSAAPSSSAATSSAATSATAASSSVSSVAAATSASSSAAVSSSAPASSSAAPAGKAVTLTYCSPDSPGRYDVENAIFADFTKANPDIKVEIVSPGAGWTDVETKLKTTIAAGTPLSFFQNGWGFWFDVQSALLDLTPLFARDKIDPLKVFVPTAIDFFSLNGKVWGVPVVGISVDALAYNQDMFDVAGLAHLPTDPDDQSFTMDQFLMYAQRLTKPENLQFGFGGSVGGGETDGIERPTYFGGGPWDDTAHKALMDQPPALEGLQFFKDLRDKYNVQPTSAQAQSIGAKGNIFTSGKIGMQVIYGYVPKLTFKWAIVPLPHSAPKNISGRAYPQTLQATQTPTSEQTWTLFKWMIVPANAARFPLSAHYAVSPVVGASDLAKKAYLDQVGVDPSAFQAMADRAGLEAGGMYRYSGWNVVNKWMDDNFKAFDTGKQTASDYGKAVTAFINAHLVQG